VDAPSFLCLLRGGGSCDLAAHSLLHPSSSSNAAHIISGRDFPPTRRADHLFLLLRRWPLFPYSKGRDDRDSVAAGKLLNVLCGEVWEKLAGDSGTPCELSNWNFRRERFVRKFDRALTETYGAANLDILLKRRNTRLDSWLAACETQSKYPPVTCYLFLPTCHLPLATRHSPMLFCYSYPRSSLEKK
jgi:hypothetical protein